MADSIRDSNRNTRFDSRFDSNANGRFAGRYCMYRRTEKSPKKLNAAPYTEICDVNDVNLSANNCFCMWRTTTNRNEIKWGLFDTVMFVVATKKKRYAKLSLSQIFCISHCICSHKLVSLRIIALLLTQLLLLRLVGDDLMSLLFHFLDEFLFVFSAEPFFIARVCTAEKHIHYFNDFLHIFFTFDIFTFYCWRS